jgi:hypothetical protein
LKSKYASHKIGEIKAVRGKWHDYLAMTLNFTIPGVLQVDMTYYMKQMIQECTKKLSGKLRCPLSKNLYKVDKKSPKIAEDKSSIFHTFFMKSMFLCKHVKQDVLLSIVFLATRVKGFNQQDYIKLVKLMNYLKAMDDEIPKTNANDCSTQGHKELYRSHHDT